MNNQILAVGSIALDSILTVNGRRNNLIGGSATYFSLVAKKYSKVNVVGIVGDDFPQIGWDLFKHNNINISNIQTKQGSTFKWSAKYSDDYNERTTLFTNLGVFEDFSPIIQGHSIKSKYIFLGNIHPSLQLKIKNQASTNAIIICDTMNLWIDNNVEELNKLISDVDIFLLNDEEAIQLTRETTIIDAGKKLLNMGPTVIIIKQGALGSTFFQNDTHSFIPAIPNINVIDPTGAGDTFAGGFVGFISKNGLNDMEGAIIAGTAWASFAVESFGTSGLSKVSTNDINKRIDLLTKYYKDL